MCLKRFLFIFCTATLFTVFFASLAFATVPSTSISLNPTVPDGYFGWYRTIPSITLPSDQGGSTTKYKWDSIPDTSSLEGTTYTGSFSALTGNYSTGAHHILYYYSYVGSEIEAVKFFVFKVDPLLPPRAVGGTCEGCHGTGAYKDQVTFLN